MEGVSPEDGFWSSLCSASLYLLPLPFYGNLEEAWSLPHHCAVVTAKWETRVVLSLPLDQLSGLMRSVCVNCP